jgi:hypothetical protein
MPTETSDDRDRLLLARNIVAETLSTRFKTWRVVDELVVGPGTLAVKVDDQHRLVASISILVFW